MKTNFKRKKERGGPHNNWKVFVDPTDFKMAGIIDRAFPKNTFFFKADEYLEIEELISALKYTKEKHNCEILYGALEWARMVIDDANRR